MPFPFYQQLNAMDCGPTCLRMVAKYYGRHYTTDTLRQKTGYGKQGVSLLGISETAEKIGFRTRGVHLSYHKLQQAPAPAILHWDQNHFVVLVSCSSKGVKIADPARGIVSYTPAEFLHFWASSKNAQREDTGTALLLEPTPTFFAQAGEKEEKLSWSVVTQYLRPNSGKLSQVFLSLFVTSVLSLIFPFLSQSMVDTGINTGNLEYITIVLFAQLMLTFSNTVVGFIRSRLQLRISNHMNISILSDFWIKLTRLPVSYFDRHHTGDILQRIGDNKQIQGFLTGSAISTLFSLLNFFVYAIILSYFNVQLFLLFCAGNLLYFCWIRLFLRFRRKLNYAVFHVASKENNATLQLIQGMQEIRLNNAEKLKRWEWENIQATIFKINFKGLNYGQVQAAGALFINQGKDILISFMVARMVVDGQLTFGAMLAVQYIIGQLGGPVNDFISLVQSFQDARISMERLNEIHMLEDEEPADKTFVNHLSGSKNISISNLTFAYPGAGNDPVLENIDLHIPEGKVTAIVGVSGSGKTTLLKLLLKIYEQYDGEIKIGKHQQTNGEGVHFRYVSPSYWRRQCGAVLQDGYIFNDTIARNIAVGDEFIDHERLLHSCNIANILPFIESLPNSFNTQLGADGIGVSQGQRQRLLIARAIYKDPQYLFFDEATNALDANNEREIVDKLEEFFEGRTVIVVAHRLSTVKNADKIVVLHEGRIAEEGTHQQLTLLKGRYYELVKNQLELGA
ncbi:peptidase domain-containing ABC transporter [Chitinophaga solisilvae]|uniref:Peptidase domain-containing ABC transporter n=1 Tax=Chitinophaga solisilvae TaxID=1233460 RepID=A0A433WLK1_9BACT|nr:peptidase domain-containing ABC transporter [Chitinophaga solisilvae]NSL85518.1 peptidase domain-containing ABC transporter [Chitinophaga solisilvae]